MSLYWAVFLWTKALKHTLRNRVIKVMLPDGRLSGPSAHRVSSSASGPAPFLLELAQS